jgi:hypothetical protein
VRPENLKFGGGLAATMLHPAVLVALIVAALLILFLPRKNVIVPVLLMTFLVPLGQQVVFSGLHVLVLRIVIFIALIRILFSMIFSQARGFAAGLGSVDKLFMLWTFFHVVTFLLLFSFQMPAVVNQFGYLWDVAGGYLILRLLIRDEADIDRVIRTFAFIAAVLAACMLNEHLRMQNVFGVLGGPPIVPETRDGFVRAQAAFSHPLLAGAFGATLLPLFFLLWQNGKSKVLAAIGILSATIMTICAASSTPVLAYMAAIGAVCFWPFRKQMRFFRWGIVFALVALQVVMKAPVWYVISHIQLMGASSSSHRAELVDSFIRHFGDWWLIGTNSNGDWGFDMWDTSNQYVGEGVGGGLATFLCFIGMIYLCFRRIGNARKAVEADPAKEWYFWFLGAALFAHVVAFFGISYFDQTRMAWYALLVIIVVATAPVLATSKAEELQSDGVPSELSEPLPSHPWLSAPAKKNVLGQQANEFKPRRS